MSSESEDKVPVFKSWNRWYSFVLIVLVVQIIAYYIITRSFA